MPLNSKIIKEFQMNRDKRDKACLEKPAIYLYILTHVTLVTLTF